MTNGFELHGIEHLSASSLNLWCGEPALWVMERLLKRPSGVGAAAHRGTAIERGIEHGVFNTDANLEDCQTVALREFDRLISPLSGDGNREKERAILADAVAVGLPELRQYGTPSMPEDRQHKIIIELPEVPIPFLGYLDFVFDEHGIIIDLKTEHRLSSQIKMAHARQMAIYQRAKPNHEVRVAYVTPKKLGVYRLEPDQTQKSLNEIIQIATRLEKFLRISADPWELAALLSPNPDSYFWNSQKAMASRVEVYGY